MEDFILFVIDDGTLDDIFLDRFDNKLEYEEIDGDTYYKLPKRLFDKFEDWALSDGRFEPGEDWYQVDDQGRQMFDETTKINLAENYKRFFGPLGTSSKTILTEAEEDWYDEDGWNVDAFEENGLLLTIDNLTRIASQIRNMERGGESFDELINDIRQNVDELAAIVEDLS